MKKYLLGMLLIGVPICPYLQLSEIEKQLMNKDEVVTAKEIRDYYYEAQNNDYKVGDKTLKKLDRFYYQMANYNINPDGTLDKDAFSRAVRSFVESDLYCSDDEMSNWESIGPFDVGQFNGWISAVYIDKENTNRILIGGRQNGIFLSEDHGVTWNSVTDDLHYPVIGVSQIIENPTNPGHLMAATGYAIGRTSIHERLLHSDDNGSTWSFGVTETTSGTKLDRITRMRFHPSTTNLVFASTNSQVIYSTDGGMNWRETNLPGEFSDPIEPGETILFGQTVNIHDMMLTDANKLFITTVNKWTPVGHIWEGDIAPDYSVSWTLVNDQFDVVSEDVENFNKGVYSQVGIPSVSYGDGDSDILDALNELLWYRIQTEGWSEMVSATTGEPVLACDYTDTDFSEVINVRQAVNQEILTDPNTKLNLKFRLPKGLNLKFAVKNISQIPGDPDHINENTGDYDFLFNNTIYESGVATSDIEIDHSDTYFIDTDLLTDVTLTGVSATSSFYFIVEKDAALYEGGTLEIDYVHFSIDKEGELRFADFSNYVDGSFMIQTSGIETKTSFFKSDNDGIDFSTAPFSIGIEGAPAKNELILSPNNNDYFYHGVVDEIVRREFSTGSGLTIANPAVNGGHHDDYRSSQILDLGGEDYLLLGNDGGVAEINDGLSVSAPEIYSLNGNMRTNLIYTLDIHEKTQRVLVGLQDNDNMYYDSGSDLWTRIGAGDGSMTYIHPDYPLNHIVGDPQGDGTTVVDDGTLGIVDDVVIEAGVLKGNGFLGMRLEPYRTNPDRFVIGFQKNYASTEGVIMLNEAFGVTSKKPVTGCERVLGIGISETDQNLIYVTDGSESNTTSDKLFRSTDAGDSWEGLGDLPLVLSDRVGPLKELLGFHFLSDVIISPNSTDDVFCSVSKIAVNYAGDVANNYFRVIRLNEAGDGWVDYSEGLPALPVNKLLAVESDIELIFAGTAAGVYYRTSEMDSWECFSNNLPLTVMTDLEYNYCTQELYASTYGRGVYKTPVNIFLANSNNPIEITSNTIWSGDNEYERNIIVKSGNTLTISGTARMYPDTKIIVEQDAHLIVDGGHITSACGAFWHGIEVWGDNSSPQVGTGANQGKITTKLGAVIENAEEAVTNWKTGDWSTTGGIIKVYNTTFKNCKRSASFLSYTHPSMDTYGYQASFTDSRFEWNDDFLTAKPQPHVTMLGVDRVLFSGCDFTDERTGTTTVNAGVGIRSIDANYNVLGRYIALVASPEDEYFDDEGYDIGTFTNLLTGIECMNTLDDNTLKVDHIRFVNCKNGIYVSEVNSPIITRNSFENDATANSWVLAPVHASLNVCHNYQIEGNNFSSIVVGNNATGLHIENSGVLNNVVYKNRYGKLMFGNYSKFVNRNDVESIARTTGLEYRCNEYERNSFADEYIYGTSAEDGIRLIQGSVSEAAGNLFKSASPFTTWQVAVSPAITATMNYYHSDGGPFEYPVGNTFNVNPVITGNINTCISSYAGQTIGVEEPPREVRTRNVSIPQNKEEAFDAKMEALKNSGIYGSEIMDDFIRFKTNLFAYTNGDGVLEELSYELEYQLKSYTSSGNQMIRVEAQNLLCFYTGDCVEPIVEIDLPVVNTGSIVSNTEAVFALYPNPAKRGVWVEIKTDEQSSASLKIYDMEGRLVQNPQSVGKKTFISLNELNSGIYLVKLIGNDTNVIGTQKLVIE